MVKEITPKANQQTGKTKARVKTKKKVATKANAKVRKVVSKTKRKAVTTKKVVPKIKKKVVVRKKVAQKKLRVVERVAPKTRKKVVVKRKDAPKKRKASKRKVAKKKMSVPKKIGGMRTAAFGFLVTGIFELVMAIPIIGWLMGVGSFGVMWVIGIVINIVVIVALINRKKAIYANIFAIVANVLGIVPVLGWFLHLIATILLFVLFFKEERKNC